MSSSSMRRLTMSGRVYDPVFLCMIGAVILAVGTSIALRVMVGGGPAAAHAAQMPISNQVNAEEATGSDSINR